MRRVDSFHGDLQRFPPSRARARAKEPVPVRGAAMAIVPGAGNCISLPLCLFATSEAKPRTRFDARRMNSHGPLSPFGADANRTSNAFVLHKLRMDRN